MNSSKISIQISEPEKRRLLIYMENVMEQGHWGDGRVTIPDEQVIYDLVKEAGDSIELPVSRLRILLEWIYETTDGGAILINEDMSLLQKISDSLKERGEEVQAHYNIEIKNILDSLKLTGAMLPETKKDDTMSLLEKENRAMEDDLSSSTRKDHDREEAGSAESPGEAEKKEEDGPPRADTAAEERGIKYVSKLDTGKDRETAEGTGFKGILKKFTSFFSGTKDGSSENIDREDLKSIMEKNRLLAKKISKKKK